MKNKPGIGLFSNDADVPFSIHPIRDFYCSTCFPSLSSSTVQQGQARGGPIDKEIYAEYPSPALLMRGSLFPLVQHFGNGCPSGPDTSCPQGGHDLSNCLLRYIWVSSKISTH